MLTANRVQGIFDSLNSGPWPAPWGWSTPWDSIFSDAFHLPAEIRRPRMWSAEDAVVLEVDLPGRELDDIDVSIENNLLIVRTQAPLYGEEQDGDFRIRERSDGEQTMQFRLPFHIPAEQVDVVYHNGVLRITIKKQDADKPRKLTVRAG